MKTIRLLAVTAFAFIFAVASAVEKPRLNIIPLQDEKALLTVSNSNPVKFEMNIESQDGRTVFSQESDKEITGMRKLLDFSELANGDYVIKLKANDTYVLTDLNLKNKELNIKDQKVVYAPYINFENEILKLTYLNFDQKDVKIRISDDKGFVFERKLGKEFTIHGGYNLSKLPKGNYQVELLAADNDYVSSIEK